MTHQGVRPMSYEAPAEAYAAFIEVILRGILSAEGKAIWCGRWLPKTYALLMANRDWDALFGGEEE